MNKQILHFLSLIANAASLHTLLSIFCYRDANVRGFILWCVLIAISSFLIHTIITCTNFPQLIVPILVAVLIIQILSVIHWNYVPDRNVGWLWFLIAWSVTLGKSCNIILNPASAEQHITDFELSVLTLILSALMTSVGSYSIEMLLAPVCGTMASLFALCLKRTASYNSSRSVPESLLLFCIPPGLFAIAAIFISYPAKYCASFVNKTGEHGLDFLHNIGTYISRFFQWLFSLIPERTPTPLDVQELPTVITQDSDRVVLLQTDLFLPILIIMILVVVISLCIFLKHLPEIKEDFTDKKQKQKSFHPFSVFWFLLTYCFQKAVETLFYIKYSNTPEGLFYHLENYLRRHGKKREQGVTYRQFLINSKDSFTGCDADLEMLANWLDYRYYSKLKIDVSKKEIQKMRKRLKSNYHKNTDLKKEGIAK